MLTRGCSASRSHLGAMEMVGLMLGESIDDFVYQENQHERNAYSELQLEVH
jgi:hypothetical protein